MQKLQPALGHSGRVRRGNLPAQNAAGSLVHTAGLKSGVKDSTAALRASAESEYTARLFVEGIALAAFFRVIVQRQLAHIYVGR